MNCTLPCPIESDPIKCPSDSSMISEEQYIDEIFPKCDHLCYVKKISDAKFPVYLVFYPRNQHYYAMKIFPWDDGVSTFFAQEVQFCQFPHANIIPFVYYEYEADTTSIIQRSKVSYILMEYAKYGDFFDVLITYKIPFDDKLVRTYFRQLMDGLDALHSKGAAHLDLKLENLLMADDFTLKIADFDLSFLPDDSKVKTRGTKNFRAPEMLRGNCNNPQAADIYSAGIILFLLKTGGMVPFKEDGPSRGIDMEELKQSNPKKFWEKQCEFLGKKSSFFGEDFKNLFMRMTKPDPKERPTIAQIRNSRWYLKEIFAGEELFDFMDEKFSVL